MIELIDVGVFKKEVYWWGGGSWYNGDFVYFVVRDKGWGCLVEVGLGMGFWFVLEFLDFLVGVMECSFVSSGCCVEFVFVI